MTAPVLYLGDVLTSSLPIMHPKLWAKYSAAKDNLWQPSDVEFSADVLDWLRVLSGAERGALLLALQTLSSSAEAEATQLPLWYTRGFCSLESRYFYGLQIAKKNIHVETYEILLGLFTANLPNMGAHATAHMNSPQVRAKKEWASKWLQDVSKSMSERLTALICVGGVFASTSLAVALCFREKNLLPGLSRALSLIATDDEIHLSFASAMVRQLPGGSCERAIRSIFSEAVDLETDFALHSLGLEAMGLCPIDIAAYIRFRADELLSGMGHRKYYRVSNPLNRARHLRPLNRPGVHTRRDSGAFSLSSLDQVTDSDTTLNWYAPEIQASGKTDVARTL
ncbi:ferritin-like superfamily [Ephemerocybe angulata]|uniref:Ferritin-like superfamily n=1 Tax=Ephemerocybe angulata TaxID=980116 RepID=A0A8H6IGY4_9AGAR|nr:ferritin-like superfamily [Tulosesus angulatus]